jgi:mRNA interferase RelE/StbE
VIYKVKFTKGAKKMFKKLSQELQDRIQIKIDDLAIQPRPNGVKKLNKSQVASRRSQVQFCNGDLERATKLAHL